MFSNIAKLISGLLVVISILPSLTHAQGIIYSEDFEGLSGTNLPDWAPYGAPSSEDYWYVDNGDLYSGNGDNLGSTNRNWLLLDTNESSGWLNYNASVDVTTRQEIGAVQFAFRWIDNQNYYFAEVQVIQPPGFNDLVRIANIYKIINGREISLADKDSDSTVGNPIPAIEDGNSHRFEVQADGTRLTFLIDGSIILEAQDADHITGSIALGMSLNDVVFDNLRIERGSIGTLPAAGTTGGSVYRVPVMTGQSRANAELAFNDLQNAGYQINAVMEEVGNDVYDVYLGPFTELQYAQDAQEQLFGDSFAPGQPELYTPSSSTDTEVADTAPRPTPILPTPIPQQTPSARDLLVQELADIEAQAKTAEDNDDLDVAQNYWAQYIVKAQSETDKEYGRAQKERVAQLMSFQPAGVPSTIDSGGDDGGSGSLLYIIIGVVGVVVIGGVAFVFLKKGKKEDAAPVAKKPAAKPDKKSDGLSALPKNITPKPVAPKTGASQSDTETDERSPQDVSETARIKPGTRSKAPTPPPVESDEEVSVAGLEDEDEEQSSKESVDIGEVRSPSGESPKRPSLATPKPAAKSDKADSGLSLDFLFDENEKKEEKDQRSSTEFVVPPPPDSDVDIPAGSSADFKADDPKVVFAQDFSGEDEGKQPSGWSGDYDYASLQVVSDDSRANSKCLRFEKSEGTGSALYTLKFPEAGGRFIVEFDIRCDEKNKYLLGFYLEKDGNFRQSISTIVHRTNSKANPTLRLQNESTPYEFGQWSSVKFDIDLPRHLVDGFVDEKPVLTAARLTQAPKVINSMSIRDNLATTGTLLIRDIKVYRV